MGKSYFEQIRELTKNVPVELVDFSQPRNMARIPTQATSDFILNKEQGDWAENLIMRAINGNAQNHVAVKYGKSDDLIAGEEGFDTFFQEFQEELDAIGKRPDLLIFRKSDFDEAKGFDISHIPHEEIDSYVRKAIAGIEVRSSAFLIDHYEEAMLKRTEFYTKEALTITSEILSDYRDLLERSDRKSYISVLEGIDEETIHIADFKVPGWRSSERLILLNDLLKKLKSSIKEVQKRDYLSITPKDEDMKVVYKWIETFNVPHYYFQVFFDKVYGISFENVLRIISNPDNEGPVFSVESKDARNQHKTTFKIKSKIGVEVASKVDEPQHKSVRKEMARGRLFFYVTFQGGTAYLDVENLKSVLGIKGQF